MLKTQYPSDLSDGQWQLIRKLIPRPSRRGCPRIDRWWIVDAVLYVVRTGCQWLFLPKEFPNWNTVYGVYRHWIRSGVWERIHRALRENLRKVSGKNPVLRWPSSTVSRCERRREESSGVTTAAR